MTNKQALQAVIQCSVDDISLEKALVDADIDPDSNYGRYKSDAIDQAAIPLLQGLLTRANISEGGFSESFDRTAVEARLKQLEEKLGLSSSTPTVRARNVW